MNKETNKLGYLFIALLFFSSSSYSAVCDFLDLKPQPNWVNNEQTIPGYYVGVGVSGKSRKGSDYQINKSAQDAKRNLAENIQVTIQSSLTILQSSSTNQNGESIAQEDAESLVNTTANASLKNVITDEIWLDQGNCLVWTRVKVKKSIVELEESKQREKIKLIALEEQLETVDIESAKISDELNKLALVESLFKNINFSLINESTKQRTLKLRIQQLNNALKGNVTTKINAESLFKQAREQLSLASTDSGNRKQHITKALTHFKTLLDQNPFNEDNHDWSEKASYEIITIELKRKNPCAAQFYIEKIINLSDSRNWQLKAKKLRRKARCNAKARQAYHFRNTFDAKTVAVMCSIKIESTTPWNNVCQKIVTYFNRHGAVAQQVQTSNAADFDFLITINGSGEVSTRQASGKTEYQLKANITTLLSHQDSIFSEEEYSGIGGWNPISQNMAIDVTGIHVYKRFIKLIQSEIEG